MRERKKYNQNRNRLIMCVMEAHQVYGLFDYEWLIKWPMHWINWHFFSTLVLNCTYPIKMLLLFCSVVLGRRPPPTKRITRYKISVFFIPISLCLFLLPFTLPVHLFINITACPSSWHVFWLSVHAHSCGIIYAQHDCLSLFCCFLLVAFLFYYTHTFTIYSTITSIYATKYSYLWGKERERVTKI